ncbi:uncharacterized protein LOC133333117 [Musca vetustissima]|uniref:uncharacterized protein LOC133333117 n=1 Tax=Musca vetustissima TaxID=27455 RepID=UPI002AB62A2E|nr:uncharacterized protein LOC133333117 [Musca vetustissima]
MTSPIKHRPYWPFIITVVSVLLQGTLGQSYHFIIGHHQRNFDQLYRDPPPNTRQYTSETNNTDSSSESDSGSNNNSTIILVQNTVHEGTNELSQTAMDIITIVWYVATFLALAAFFLLMACSDRRCADTSRNPPLNANETPIPPPTPSPSYSEFAPPSYDSVMKLQHANKTSIFVIPFAIDQPPKDNTNQAPSTPTINVYTINELQKSDS